jgi:hypothetical protein
MGSGTRNHDELLRRELRASLRILRSDRAEERSEPRSPVDAPRRFVVVTCAPADEEPLPTAQRILASTALAASLLIAVAALSEAAADATKAMEPRAVASLSTGRSHFGFGQ